MSSAPAMFAPGSGPRRASGWTDAVFAQVAEVVFLVAGNVFPPNRQPSAESGMRRVMTSYRLRDPRALLAAVSQAGEIRDALLAELTVGETYFFREFGALQLLESELLPAAARRGAGRPLRIWSAGCASGEEPYSIAMRLRELGNELPAHILGTDIARPRLDAARRGRYTRWSMRGVSSSRMERWFEARGPHFVVVPEIRAEVEFRQLNLVSGEYPSAERGDAQDLVLCRNVLIYFDMSSVREIATRLLGALQPDGWLLLGASDPPLADLVPCRLVMTPQGAAYQRDDAPSRPGRPVHPVTDVGARRTARVEPPRVDVPRPAPPAHREPVAPAKAVGPQPDDEQQWVNDIRALANRGELAAAGEQSARALETHRLSAELHHLHALLLLEGGHPAAASQAVRRALYLQPAFPMAYLLLGDALARLNDAAGACRAYANAQTLLESVGDDIPLLAGDGVVARRVRQIVAQRLEVMACSR